MRDKITLNGEKSVHFIGIGGISMSGLAEILHRDGFVVSGSDDVSSETTNRLMGLGIKIDIPNAAENISPGLDLVVYTAAVKPENAEFHAAKEAGIPLVERAAFIGEILHGYDPICIAGSHGKTTTTSMVAEVTLAAGLDPTISIGGHMNSGGLNYRVGNSPCFVLEACEYSNSFHHWHPQIGIILNVDADHLDFFGSFENLIESFAKFAQNIRPEGTLVIQEGVSGFEKITHGLACNVVTFGIEPPNRKGSGHQDHDSTYPHFWTRDIHYNAEKPSFDVMCGEDLLARVNMQLPGEYNMLNALACFAAAFSIGIPPEITASALSEAQGTKRRFELKGIYNGAKIIDDYAHHPTEIKSCLAAARRLQGEDKIICLFQPHTYTRTKNLLHDFAESFTDADEIILLPIYAAREPFDPNISSEVLAGLIKERGGRVISFSSFSETGNYLENALLPDNLLITMGAGDVFRVGDALLA